MRAIDQEEERYSNQINTYIADRIKEIKIDNIEIMDDDWSYSIMRGVKKGANDREKVEEINSNKETVVTDNKSLKS